MEAERIKEMFDSHEVLDQQRFGEVARNMKELRYDLFDNENGWLPKIERQTREHNHRMSKLEEWKNRVLGAMAVLMTLILPIVFYAIIHWK